MTLQGAIQELHAMRSDENFTFYYKPVIDKVIETLEMDAQEVRHGWWIHRPVEEWGASNCKCSVCGTEYFFPLLLKGGADNYCGNCGARMNLKEQVK